MGYFKSKDLKSKQKSEIAPKKHTVLLVDDEQENLDALSELLEKKYNIKTAANGQLALDLIKAEAHPEQIHLIISDQRMSHMNGVDFLRETLSIIPQSKRIILTGFADIEVSIGAINQGEVYKFITKPFEPQDMLITIQRALEVYDLEQQNLELIRNLKVLNAKLEEKLENQHETQFRKLHVETMRLSVLCWEMATQKSKAELAVESNIWSHYFDKKGTLRAKNMNRYLREKTLPQKPKTHLVINTAEFVLQHCPPEQKLRPLLEMRLEELNTFILEAPIS